MLTPSGNVFAVEFSSIFNLSNIFDKNIASNIFLKYQYWKNAMCHVFVFLNIVVENQHDNATSAQLLTEVTARGCLVSELASGVEWLRYTSAPVNIYDKKLIMILCVFCNHEIKSFAKIKWWRVLHKSLRGGKVGRVQSRASVLLLERCRLPRTTSMNTKQTFGEVRVKLGHWKIRLENEMFLLIAHDPCIVETPNIDHWH